MIDPLTATKQQLYDQGVKIASEFCLLNGIYLPEFLTYAEANARQSEDRAFKLLRKLQEGELQGTRTGYYYEGHVFVNVPVTAKPSPHPVRQHRSYPGNKTDRTATGVVAHEVGHHVDEVLEAQGVHSSRRCSPWVNLAKHSKTVSGYEPVPSEAWAETMRLHILNPDLLRQASPERFRYLVDIVRLHPVVTDDFRSVLAHPEYIVEAEKWIARA